MGKEKNNKISVIIDKESDSLTIGKGYMGYKGVLGHEFVGVVESVGKNVDKNLIGKRVVGEINCACNSCPTCYQNLQRHCPNRQTLGIWQKDGCFSEYFTLPVENVIEISNNIDDITATFTEPLAAAYEILEQVHIKPFQKVAILGDGKLGLCISLVFAAMNIDYIHIGKHEEKLQISKNLGAKTKLLNEIDLYINDIEYRSLINWLVVAQSYIKIEIILKIKNPPNSFAVIFPPIMSVKKKPPVAPKTPPMAGGMGVFHFICFLSCV